MKAKNKWFIAGIVSKYVEHKRPKNKRLYHVNEDYILVRAPTALVALRKAKKFGREENEIEMTNERGERGHFIFVGISELLPVYERFDDYSLLMYTDYPSLSEVQIKQLVRAKARLLKPFAKLGHKWG